MKLENVLKILAGVTAVLVAVSEVLTQANEYKKLNKSEEEEIGPKDDCTGPEER